MLEIGNRTISVDGVTIFADHNDPNQFWYLPGPVRLARRRPDNRAAFTFIKYAHLNGDSVDGKGFLSFEVDLALEAVVERRIMARLAAIAPGQPKLSVVPFDEGEVACIALDLQGGGGTVAQVSEEGTFQAIERILGAVTPAMHGSNSAAFSLTLDEAGATIMEQVLAEGGTPIGAVYNLKFTGLRPSLEVEISANFKRVYEHFSANLEAQVYIIRAGIEAGLEKLVQDGVIDIKVTNYSTEDERSEQEQWALKFFSEKLINDWFKPTLTPGQLQGGMAEAESLDKVYQRAQNLRPKPTPVPPKTTADKEDQGEANIPEADKEERVVRSGTPEGPAKLTHPPKVEQEKPVKEQEGMPPKSDKPEKEKEKEVRAVPNQPPDLSQFQVDSTIVSFKLKYIKQIEDKKVKLKYSRRAAVQQTYAPQGFFGLLAEDLSREGYFFEIDGDDPFFREFRVTVETPIEVEAIGLLSTHLQLQYNTADESTMKQADFIIDQQNNEKFDWVVKAIPDVNEFQYQLQYHFDPDSDWEGDRYSYEFPAVQTKDRTLMVHPYGKIGFLEIDVNASQVDWQSVSNIELYLMHKDKGTGKRLFFTEEDSQNKKWKLRLNDPSATTYTYQLTYFFRDGTKRVLDPQETDATTVFIPNPFSTLQVEFLPLFLPNEIKWLYIDLKYNYLDGNYEKQHREKIPGNSFDSVQIPLNFFDAAARHFEYRFIIVDKDNKLKVTQYKHSTETLIGIQLP